MTRKFGYFIAFVIAALGAGAWFYWFDSDNRVAAMSRGHAAQDETTAASSERSPGLEPANGRNQNIASDGAAVVFTDNSNSRVVRNPSSSDANPQVSPSEMDGLSVPEGAPFPVAESIEKECASGNDSAFDCAEVWRVLKKIEDERRDTHWGTSMEARIRAAVGTFPGLRIRALACRSTVCAVETDVELVTIMTWISLEEEMLTSGFVRTSERTRNGGGIPVQLWTFKRRR